MLILNVTSAEFFDSVDLNKVFYSERNCFINGSSQQVFNLAKAKLVGQSLVLTKCECLVNEYTDDLLALNERETEDDAASAAVNSI